MTSLLPEAAPPAHPKMTVALASAQGAGPVAGPVAPRGPDEGRDRFRARRREIWDRVACSRGARRGAAAAYHRRLREVYGHLATPGLRVLELGSGPGDLLAALRPYDGVGLDLSPEMVALASRQHGAPLRFMEGDADRAAELLGSDVERAGPFDVIVLSDLLNDLFDVQSVLRGLHPLCHPGTRILINVWSRLWQWPLGLARRMGMATEQLPQNWLTVDDVRNLLELSGFELVRHASEVLLPLPIPLVAPACNRVLAKMAPFRWFDLTNVFVARPAPSSPSGVRHGAAGGAPTVTVVVPARNEAGNIERIVDETPQLGGGTELIIVEGNSTDDTWETIQRVVADRGCAHVKVLKQPGKGKNDAVLEGFRHATGDVLMILDADLTVHPTALHHFYEAIAGSRSNGSAEPGATATGTATGTTIGTATGEFINGVRLVYPMEDRAMQFLNMVANRFFGVAFSWLLGQRIRDTLCGTKVMWREDYLRLVANRAYFGDFDPFGDFDLIFGAARLNLRIRDLPIRYRERTYGTTNISRWRHGLLLFRMLGVAMRKLKFI